MTTRAQRIEALVTRRIAQRRFDRDTRRRRGAPGLHFLPLQPAWRTPPVGRDYQRRRCPLSEFMAFHDRHFVQNAYLLLLKRDADLEGLNDRLQRLQSGEMSRLELLVRLRYGPEGKEQGTSVPGLLRSYAIERAGRLPLVGVVVRFFRGLLYLTHIQRELEELRGLVAMQKNDSDDRDRTIVDFQNVELQRIVQHLEKDGDEPARYSR